MFRAGITAVLIAHCAFAQSKFEYWPGVFYDSSVPNFHQVLGYDAGERITSAADIVKYLEVLAAAKPARIKVHDYGGTWENRRLIYAVIGSAPDIHFRGPLRDSFAGIDIECEQVRRACRAQSFRDVESRFAETHKPDRGAAHATVLRLRRGGGALPREPRRGTSVFPEDARRLRPMDAI